MKLSAVRIQAKNLFVCGDIHYGHDNAIIWGNRGCRAIEHHDHMIEEALVGLPRGAKVVNLGDLAECSIKRLRALFELRPDVIWYHLFGNHDETLSKLRRVEGGKMEGHTFLGISAMLEVRYPKLTRRVWAAHYPHVMWPEQSEGSWHLCGHAHRRLSEFNPGTATEPRLDLGVENAIENGRIFIPWIAVETMFKSAHIPQFSGSVQYKSGDKVMLGDTGVVATILYHGSKTHHRKSTRLRHQGP